MAVTLFIVRRRIEIGPDDTAITTTLGLIRELVVPLLCGPFMLCVTVRGLLRGEVACSAKGGGCATPTYLRAMHPEHYWVNLGFFALATAVALRFAWAGYRRWCLARVR